MSKLTRTELTAIALAQAEAFADMVKRLVALEKQVEELTAKPKLKGSDLTRKMLKDGAESIKCYVCDESDEMAIGDDVTAKVYSHDGIRFKTNGLHWKYAVPVDSIGAKK